MGCRNMVTLGYATLPFSRFPILVFPRAHSQYQERDATQRVSHRRRRGGERRCRAFMLRRAIDLAVYFRGGATRRH